MKRIQRSRKKGWRMPPNTVYVGRPSRWGNPFIVDSYTPNAKECIEGFKLILETYKRERPDWFEDYFVAPLRGHDIACWCALDKPCHADVWIALINEEQLHASE